MANTLDQQYQELLRTILDYGVDKMDRTGTGTKSIFGYTIRHNMREGFPLLTTKKMHWHSIVTELVWFLRGDTNIRYLVENGCHIWDGDAYKSFYNSALRIREAYTEGSMMGSDSMISEVFSDPDSMTILSQPEFIQKVLDNEEFASLWGELGPVYGKQWRNWEGFDSGVKAANDLEWGEIRENGYGIDQIAELIKQLRENPDSRRLLVTAWNPTDLDVQTLPPCHYGFQVYTRELTFEERLKWVMRYTDVEMENLAITERASDPSTPSRAISLMWNQRSCDVFLGLPFNIASYGLLLTIIAKEVNMVPDQLIGNLGDTHLYLNHLDQAQTQLSRAPYPLPTVDLDYRDGEYSKDLKGFVPDDFVLFNYQSHSPIKAPLSN